MSFKKCFDALLKDFLIIITNTNIFSIKAKVIIKTADMVCIQGSVQVNNLEKAPSVHRIKNYKEIILYSTTDIDFPFKVLDKIVCKMDFLNIINL